MTASPVAPLSTLVLCNQAEWMDAMPTLLVPETLPIAYRTLTSSPDSNLGEPHLPDTDSRSRAAGRKMKKRRAKLAPLAIPTHANPYAHLPRLKITGRRKKENPAESRNMLLKNKARPPRTVLRDAVSSDINVPSLALSGWLRSKEGFDTSQTSPPPLGLRSSIGWPSSLSISRFVRSSTSMTTSEPNMKSIPS
ncbi:hypothetical protein E4T56_gene1806 [Termitomyces sp. T112]|nr:hypothetical protein E4T56_gene1806 [Termitomyces sp. T112]